MSTNNIGRWRLLPEEDANILSHASLGAMISSLLFVADRFDEEEELCSSGLLSIVEPRSLLRGRNRSLPNEEKAQQAQDGVGATTCGI